jgi:hypothetical protein
MPTCSAPSCWPACPCKRPRAPPASQERQRSSATRATSATCASMPCRPARYFGRLRQRRRGAVQRRCLLPNQLLSQPRSKQRRQAALPRRPALIFSTSSGGNDGPKSTKRIAILGLGPSLRSVHWKSREAHAGSRQQTSATRRGAINALGDVFACDRCSTWTTCACRRSAPRQRRSGNIAADAGVAEDASTGRSSPAVRTQITQALQEFPLEAVARSTGYAYFNSTAAYAVAYAIHRGFEKITAVRVRLHLSERAPRREGAGLRRVLAGHSRRRAVCKSRFRAFPV